MRNQFNYFFTLIMICGIWSCSSSQQAEKMAIRIDTEQLVLVFTKDWDAHEGFLFLLSKEDSSSWKKEGEIPIVIGKNGMAWGKGLEDFSHLDGPKKEEGDGKSPAGIFKLGTAFGYAPDSLKKTRGSYLQVTNSTMCIEDTGSGFYNSIVDSEIAINDWSSTDKMLRDDSLYEFGFFINANPPPSEKGSGSCIFIHQWRTSDKGTAGCTASSKEDLIRLHEWVDSDKNPHFIQCPLPQYEILQSRYGLPAIKYEKKIKD